MPWFRVDDTLAFHSKTLVAGNAAMGLWVRAGAWSMQQLTDGRIPHPVARQLGTKTEAKRLCDAGLWDEIASGYRFHEWKTRQPTAKDVKHMHEVKGAAATYGNHIRWHADRGQLSDDCTWCQKEFTEEFGDEE